MKRNYFIRDFYNKDDGDRPFYYTNYSSDTGNWTPVITQAQSFNTEQEAVWKIEEILKNEYLYLEIVTVYSN